ncbi:MAG TPA: choice-of-anchor D domain-containing protein, partial [Kofleriaceae bacterium]|nr:choice-of-anchor D domain-containing protein [Kofleriaceae bacterium]
MKHMRCSLMISIGLAASLGAACGEVETNPDAGPGQPDASMNVDGGSDVSLAIDKTEHDFGTVVTNSSSAATTFTITNTGTAPSGSLAVGIAGGDAADFSIDTDGCDGAPLAAAASCEIEISYMPAQAGSSAATLTVSGSPGGDLSAVLSGDAVSPGALAISPTDHGFPAVVVGDSGTAATFTVTNTGGTTTGALSVALTGSDMDQFTIGANGCSGQTLAGSATCTVAVALTPGSAGS